MIPDSFASPGPGMPGMAGPPKPPAGSIAPREGPVSPETEQFGEFYEKLPDEVKAALRKLKDQMKFETISARRDEVRRVRQAREFWKGIQNIYWSEAEQRWRLPFESGPDDKVDPNEQPPRYDFITNIFQAFGLSVISVLSQAIPSTRFFPQSTQQEVDVATARSATDIEELIRRNNRAGKLLEDMAFYFWTDGKLGTYTRFVRDAQRFGTRKLNELQEGKAQIRGPVFHCPECGTETPADQAVPIPEADPMGALGIVGSCQTCLQPLSAADLKPAEEAPIPVPGQEQEFPNGQEVVDVIGALELKTPLWAKEQHDFPYLIWAVETHVAKLRATYPHAAAQIKGESGAGGEDEYERIARLRLAYGGTINESSAPLESMVTFERCWFRPWAFYLLEESELRDQLLQLFPRGVYVGFAGEAFCEARPESLDDHWVVAHAMPGDGQNRPALGTSLVSVQERYNTLQNLAIETIEYGVPPTYVDAQLLDPNALEDQTVEPGAHYFLYNRPATGRIGDGFYQPPAAQMHPQTLQLANELMGPIGQFLTGAFPALFGGSMDNVDTASGYAMARDQAMGRLGLVWRNMKYCWSDTMVLAVECFVDNRSEDVEIPLLGKGATYDAKWIRIADLRGGFFAEPETEEQFPSLWTQQRSVMMQLLQAGDPLILEWLSEPDNLALAQRMIGLVDFKIPGNDSREKQYKEIQQLIEGMPAEIPDPLTGQVAFQPTVDVDPFVDNHEVELQVCLSWLNSPTGQACFDENPGGWANVKAHAMAHEEQLRMRAAEAAAAQQMADLVGAPAPEQNQGKGRRALPPGSNGNGNVPQLRDPKGPG